MMKLELRMVMVCRACGEAIDPIPMGLRPQVLVADNPREVYLNFLRAMNVCPLCLTQNEMPISEEKWTNILAMIEERDVAQPG